MGRRELKRRAQAEAALQQNEERFRLMIATIRDYSIVRLDPEGGLPVGTKGRSESRDTRPMKSSGNIFRNFIRRRQSKAALRKGSWPWR